MPKFVRYTNRRRMRKKAKVPKAVKSYVQKSLDASIEDKHRYIQVGPFTLNTGTPVGLTNIVQMQQGVLWGQRIGKKIKVKSIDIKLIADLVHLTSDPLQDYYIRVMFGRQFETKGVLIPISDDTTGIFPTAVTAGLYPFETPNPFTLRNKDRGGTYQIYSDTRKRIETYESNAGLVNSTYRRIWHLHKNFKNPVSMTFNSLNVGDITDILDNAFFLLVATDMNRSVALNSVTYHAIFDIKYEDA